MQVGCLRSGARTHMEVQDRRRGRKEHLGTYKDPSDRCVWQGLVSVHWIQVSTATKTQEPRGLA